MILFHDVSLADQEILASGELINYVWVGAKHMLTGYDHILFLVGVVFFLNHIKDIIRFVTAFTVGHSITLVLATYINLTVNEHIIDAVIGMSVFYKGFENLGGFEKVFKTRAPLLIQMVFLFGLIHGLGLSARLQSLSLEQDRTLLQIVSFNFGVELGQIVALAPILLLVNFIRTNTYFVPLFKAVNSYLLIAGVYLAITQLLNL